MREEDDGAVSLATRISWPLVPSSPSLSLSRHLSESRYPFICRTRSPCTVRLWLLGLSPDAAASIPAELTSQGHPPSHPLAPVKGPSELKLNIDIATDKTVLELKEAIAAKSDVEKERQRLIYSGAASPPLSRSTRAGR